MRVSDPRLSAAGARLVDELRRAKFASGLSFARLQARTPYSRASLERYVNGKLWPARAAVRDIATACGTDPEPLLQQWDEATTCPPTDQPTAESAAVPQEPPHASRRRWITVVGVTVAAVAGLVTFVVASGRPQASPPSTGCRDFYADIRIYTVGRLCWKHADATVTGTLTNPAEPMPATAQLCVSNHPDACAETIDLATAERGETRHYRKTVHLPPGHGAWIRACLDGYCGDWT